MFLQKLKRAPSQKDRVEWLSQSARKTSMGKEEKMIDMVGKDRRNIF